MAGPKLFVSYSWTTQDHQAWVLDLATRLRQSGIDAILDKWDLKEGHDAHAFMEQMVTDPQIKKVILICDKRYVEKANGRTGGVGVEAQIITGEIYAKQAQDKFVAIVTERDGEGNPYLPAYCRSRIYIDMSEPALSSDAFEQLLRWAFDEPLYKRPEVGQKPVFRSNEQSTDVTADTTFLQKRAIDALKNHRPFAVSATEEFFDAVSRGLEKFRVDPHSEPFDDAIIKSIESFLPHRDETIAMFRTLTTDLEEGETRRLIHRFFEQLIPYLDMPDGTSTFRDWDWDNFKFIVHELFLHALATLIRQERFEAAAYLVGTRYYSPGNNAFGRDVMVPYSSIRRYMASLKLRNQRLQLNRLSLRADLLRQRCGGSTADFNRLMQADFILFLRAELQNGEPTSRWWPETLLFARSGIFEVFARARSKTYFDRLKIVLGIDKKEQLATLLNQFLQDTNRVPRWSFESFSPSHLMGFDRLATEP